MNAWLGEAFGDLGATTAESVIDSLAQGTQGVVRSIADAKSDAYKGVIATSAISVGLVLLAAIAGIIAVKELGR